MDQEKDKPAVQQSPDDETEVEPLGSGTQSSDAPSRAVAGSAADLRKASEDLKGRIDEAKRRSGLPLDSALGNPEWEKRAADGRFDLPDDDNDD